MSVNLYDPSTGLHNIAAGQRTWVGTKAAYEAAKIAGTLPTNCLVAITDDSEDNNYSTDEVLTGKFWIDGKPIYRKVIDCGTPTPTNKEITIAHGIANIDAYITVDFYLQDSVLKKLPLGVPEDTTSLYWCYVSNMDANSIIIRSGTGYAQGSVHWYAVLEYTKTTD